LLRAFAGGCASDNIAFQLRDLNSATKIPDDELYAWGTLLSRTVSIIASMSSLLQSWRSLLAKGDRGYVFTRYAALGASANQPFNFRLHLLPPMLRMDSTVHESDNGMPNTFECEKYRTPLNTQQEAGYLVVAGRVFPSTSARYSRESAVRAR